jgi:hypothetical protein
VLRRQLVLARARVQSGLRDLALLLLKALLVDALGRGHKQVAAWRRQDLIHAETETERTQKSGMGWRAMLRCQNQIGATMCVREWKLLVQMDDARQNEMERRRKHSGMHGQTRNGHY